MEYILMGYSLINCLFSSYVSLLLLWAFSIFCICTSDELAKKKKVKVRLVTRDSDKIEFSAADSIVRAEKFVRLFQVWLHDEESFRTGSDSVEEKIGRLKKACKVLKKIQIVIDSLKTWNVCNLPSTINESKRDVLDKFEHMKAHIELRLCMLTMVERQFSVFMEQGKLLKIWLSEALELHESLHRTTCVHPTVIQQHLFLIQTIRKVGKVIQGNLDEYKHSASKVTATLQEMNSWSDIFQQALSEKTNQNGTRRWTEILIDSVTAEITQVALHFCTVNKLNECYQTHLEGLHQRALQNHHPDPEDSWKMNRLVSLSLDAFWRKLGL